MTISADGYFVCPPARHPEGRTYAFLEGREPWTIEIADLPKNAVAVLVSEARLRQAADRRTSGEINAGDRHEHLRAISYAMRRYSGASLEAIEAALLTENALRCKPPRPALPPRLGREYGKVYSWLTW